MNILLANSASELESFAASELQRYLNLLFGLEADVSDQPGPTADISFIIGTHTNLPDSSDYLQGELPALDEQSYLLRKTQSQGKESFALIGGSPRAVLWAVYDLVERWGVRYLLRRDVIPDPLPEFNLPDLDIICEPELPIRQWRVINDFACGPESWGMVHYRQIIDQLAKLRFNRLYLSIYAYQPFLHYECKGVKRQTACLWFDFHYPITDDMVGRELFGNEEEFWNPDLPRNASYEELSAACENLVHNLIEYGHQRGMQSVMDGNLLEYVPEFAEVLSSSQSIHQLAELTIVPTADTSVDDPTVVDLATALLQAQIDTYPEIDFISIGMPEFRQWSGQYEEAWQKLNAKYGLEDSIKLSDVLRGAENRDSYPGGSERALDEVKGDIVALYFYDHLLNETEALSDTTRPDMKFSINSVAEELYPVLPYLLKEGWEMMNFVDYTPSRIIKRRKVLADIPGRKIPASLIYTLHDDNVGVLPQLSTGSLHELTKDLYQHGWAGFSTRYWLVSDHDPCLAYLSKAGWDVSSSPQNVYTDFIESLWGKDCHEDGLEMFHELEKATVDLEWHGLGLTFPVPGMMEKHWNESPFPVELEKVREHYRKALAAARRIAEKSSLKGREDAEYWIGRFEFGIACLDSIESLRSAAIAEAEGDDKEEVLRHTEASLSRAVDGLKAYARVTRDQSDRGAIATLNEYVYRYLKAKVAELQK